MNDPLPTQTADEAIACDVSRKFVRVKEVRPNGLVIFDFSIGWPEMAAELVMPQAAFDEFCLSNQVQRLHD
jgi:phenol hydroxylase P0 protein